MSTLTPYLARQVEAAQREDDAARALARYEYSDRETALRWLLCREWSDLQHHRHHAIRRGWSMACDSSTYRIIALTRLLARPTPWDEVPYDVLDDGLYEAINAAAGYPTPLDDDARAAVREGMEKRST